MNQKIKIILLFIIFPLTQNFSQNTYATGKVDTLSKIITKGNQIFYSMYQDGNTGLLNSEGKLVVPIKYKSIKALNGGYFSLDNGKEIQLFDSKNNKIHKQKFDRIKPGRKSIISIQKNKKEGLFSIESGEVIIEPEYDEITKIKFRSDVRVLKKQDYLKLFFVDENLMIKTRFDSIDVGSRGLFFLIGYVENKVHLINKTTGEKINEFECDEFKIFRKFFAIRNNDKWKIGKYQSNSKIPTKLSPQVDTFYSIDKSMKVLVLENDSNQGIFNIDSLELEIPIEHDSIVFQYSMKGGRYYKTFNNENKVGLINQNNSPVIPQNYEDVFFISNGRTKETIFWVKNDGFFSPIVNGKVDISIRYDSFHNKSSLTFDPIYVRKEGYMGVFSMKKMREIIPCEFDTIYSSVYGTYVIKTNQKYGLLSKDGEKILAAENISITNIKHDFLKIENDSNKIGVYHPKKSKYILEPEYDEIEWIVGSFNPWMFRKKNKSGIIHFWDDKIIISLEDGFERIVPREGVDYLDSKRCTRAKKNGKWGWIDIDSGKEIIPIIYDEVQPFARSSRTSVKLKYEWIQIDSNGRKLN